MVRNNTLRLFNRTLEVFSLGKDGENLKISFFLPTLNTSCALYNIDDLEVGLKRIKMVNEPNQEFMADSQVNAGQWSSQSGLVELYLKEQHRLRRIIAGMGFGGSNAEDILQDISVKALKGTRDYQGEKNAFKYLVTVTVNRCITEYRKRSAFKIKAPEILKRQSQRSAENIELDIIRLEEIEIVRKTLRELNETLLVPVILRYFCDLNSEEIGRILEINQSTVRSRLREGRLILAKSLKARGIKK